MTGLLSADSRPDFSVVVCSHNGARTLSGTLSSLEHQSLEADRYEVIVVDDGSTDRTGELAERVGVRVVRLSTPSGLAAARNAGVRAAEGSIVAFTDDDCVPAEDWLATLAVAFADPAVDGVGGPVAPACVNPFVRRYLEAHNPLAPLSADLLASTHPAYRLSLYLRHVLRGAPELSAGEPLYSAVGANMAFRRTMILELGGFDESFSFGAEEEDLCRRANSRPGGGRLRYEPRAVVVHRFEPRLLDSLRRARAYGIGNARNAIKHGDRRPIVYPFPLFNAAVVLGALATRRRWAVAVALLAPVVQYARWPALAWSRRSLEPLTYPYLQTAVELSTMLGELEGWRAGYTGEPVDKRAREPEAVLS